MSGDLYTDGFLILLSLLFAGYISACETAILSAPKSKLDDLASQNNLKAATVLELKNRADDLIAGSQISTIFLIVFASIVGGSDASTLLQRFFASLDYSFIQGLSYWVTTILGAIFVSGFALVMSALIPKSLGLKYAIQLSIKSAYFIKFYLQLMRIPQVGLTAVANIFLKPFKDSTTFSEPQLSEEAIMTIIEKGTESGVIDQTEHDLIESIFQFTERTTKEIMIPRTSIVGINDSLPPDEILKIVVEDGYTRMPVYTGSLDNIVGTIYSKDVVSLVEHRDLIVLQDIMRPVYFVPENKSISELLHEFQRKKIHLAIVVDEFGGTEGLITLEDILEEIVGEIHDEYDEDIKPFEVLTDGSFIVDGMLNVREFNELTPFHIPESEDYDTVAGFVTTIAGKIPEEGESCLYESSEITALSVHDRRITKLKFHKIEQANEKDAA